MHFYCEKLLMARNRDQGDLKPVHTVAEKCDCRRKVRQSPNFAVVSPFSATVALFCNSVDRASEHYTYA